MLKPVLNLGQVEASGLIDYLYNIFNRDFVQRQSMLGGKMWVDPRCEKKELGKEQTFWHLITRGKDDRFPDYRRAERLEWVRQLIESPHDPCVKFFYHKESNPKQDIRLYLWAEADDFVVIIQRLGKSKAFLVTSFYVDQSAKREDYRKRFSYYASGSDVALTSHTWF